MTQPTPSRIENLFMHACGTWKNCNDSNIQSFLSKCQSLNIDLSDSLNWLEEHRSNIPNFQSVWSAANGWVNQHDLVGSGSPVSSTYQNSSPTKDSLF